MNLYFYNSLSKKKELFEPLTNQIKMYICGPTVYDTPHIGNARSVVIYDLLYRLLKYNYGEVIYVRNITDVEDKINKAAKEQNISIQELTTKFTKIFHNIVKELNCLSPTIEPKATEHINEIINMIQKLLDNKNAYLSEGHVYFDVKSFKAYTKLSGRNLSEMLSGVRIDIAEAKNNSADFVLWKPASDEDDESSIWNSPWGTGRPGWHIECSAMSNKYLGENFDIHGGGIDLIFPHHTNEIAQSCCANPGSIFAKYWIHNGFLTVNGEKMSKSLGNFTTVKDLFDQGINGEVVRYMLLSSHYRKPLDFNDKLVSDSKIALDSFYRATIDARNNNNELSTEMLEALADDLNTAKVFAIFHDMVKSINKAEGDMRKNLASILKNSLQFVGLLQRHHAEWFKSDMDINSEEIEKLITARNEAKKNKNWAEADAIRNKLQEKNILLEDKPDGTTSWKIKN